MKRTLPTIHTAIFLFSAIALTPFCALAQTPAHTNENERGIKVSGDCLRKVAQDRGAVTLGTAITAKTAQEASSETIKAHEKMKAEVTRIGLAEFSAETATYSVNQECSYETGKRICSGFRAILATRFETSDIGRLGDIIGVGAKHGSQEVSQLETFVSLARLKAERESCLEAATKNAASKAQKLASGAGVQLGRLISLQELSDIGQDHPIMPLKQRAFAMEATSEAASAGPSVDSKTIDLKVSILAHYGIE